MGKHVLRGYHHRAAAWQRRGRRNAEQRHRVGPVRCHGGGDGKGPGLPDAGEWSGDGSKAEIFIPITLSTSQATL